MQKRGNLLEEVSAFLESHQVIIQDKRLGVAVSGGADSVALLDVFVSLKKRTPFELSVIHFDHQLRDKESDEDAQFVLHLAERYQIPFFLGTADTARYAHLSEESIQVAARKLRYDYFEKVISEEKIDYLVMAHHQNDQSETFLMQLLRYTYYGMGIPFQREIGIGKIIRPFLSVTKEEIMEYIDVHNVDYREDSSNKKDIYLRNRVRQITPLLEQEQAIFHENIQKFIIAHQEDNNYLFQLAQTNFDLVVAREKERYTIMIKPFLMLPMPLQRRVIHLLLSYLFQGKKSDIHEAHIRQTIKLIQAKHPSGTIDIPNGFYVRKSYEYAYVEKKQLVNQEKIKFTVDSPGIYQLPLGDIEITYEAIKNSESSDTLFLPKIGPYRELKLRTRKNGDKIAVVGMDGHKRIKKIMIDKKIPIPFREIWPIISVGDDDIIWVVGLQKAKIEQPEKIDEWIKVQWKPYETKRGSS